jgi:hypothetical protein
MVVMETRGEAHPLQIKDTLANSSFEAMSNFGDPVSLETNIKSLIAYRRCPSGCPRIDQEQ